MVVVKRGRKVMGAGYFTSLFEMLPTRSHRALSESRAQSTSDQTGTFVCQARGRHGHQRHLAASLLEGIVVVLLAMSMESKQCENKVSYCML